MPIKLLAAVAFGGAVGSVLRYATLNWALRQFGSDFPHGTLIVNVLGSLIMGMLVELMVLSWNPSPELRAVLVVGVLGGFTTFSSFSLDFYSLLERGETMVGISYVGLSVVVSIGALLFGVHLTRLLYRLLA